VKDVVIAKSGVIEVEGDLYAEKSPAEE